MCNKLPPDSKSCVAIEQATALLPAITVIDLNDHLICFFTGRDPSGRRAFEGWNWFDDAAMQLGIAIYAVHHGDHALLYDTFTSVPHARWVRDYLERRGIKRFTVVLSHWHLDHVAGNEVFRDAEIMATQRTYDVLAENRKQIEAGTLWGLPAINPLVLPNRTFENRLELFVGDIKVELRNVNIHSADTNVLYLPADRILLAGDALEDSLTFMAEVENLPIHLEKLRELRAMDVERIYPNHGDPEVIRARGYTKTLIDATGDYISKTLSRCHDANYLSGSMEEYIESAVAMGWVHYYEPYRDVHAQNLKLVHEFYRDKPIPALS